MCCSWARLCCSLHIFYNLIYIAVGAIQIIAGIIFLISLPVFKLGSNLWTGALNIVIGVGGTVFSCVGELTPGKQQVFLCLTVFILGANLVNLIILEAGEWRLFMSDSVREMLDQQNYKTLTFYARMTTSISTLVAIVTSFLDSQLTFCSMQRRLGRKDSFSHPDIITDIEYIIPRGKYDLQENRDRKPEYLYDECIQSWVFDADTIGSQTDSLCQSTYKSQNDYNLNKTYSVKLNRDALNISNINCGSKPVGPSPVDISVEGELNTSDGRLIQNLSTFSRTPSPVFLSKSSSKNSMVNKEEPIYEYLEKLTEPSVYFSQLNSAASVEIDRSCNIPLRPHTSVVIEQPQYASLLVELQKSISEKFPRLSAAGSDQNIDEVTTKGLFDKGEQPENIMATVPENEFSKELEAALQVIQDLESPNPTELPPEFA